MALQGDLRNQIGRLRLADTSEIPRDLQFSNQAAGPGVSVLPDVETSSDSSSATDSEDRMELSREELYSSDELSETEVSSAMISKKRYKHSLQDSGFRKTLISRNRRKTALIYLQYRQINKLEKSRDYGKLR